MGIASAMSDNMKKNMEMQMAFQKELILKQRQMQMATQIAMARERFRYYSYFYWIGLPLALIGAIKKKNPQLLAPFLPITFIYAFQYDMCYGNLMERVLADVDDLITEHPTKFNIPANSGIVSMEEYNSILGIKDGKRKP